MEDWNEVKARGQGPGGRMGRAFNLMLLLTVGVVLSFVVAQHYSHDPAGPGDPEAVELAHLKMLAHALRLHADEHEGRFPTAISEIEWRQNLPAMKWAGLPAAVSRFHNPENGTRSDWRYYPGHTQNDPPDTILVAAPVALGKAGDRRMVARVNDVAEVIAEADFQRQTASTPAPAAASSVTP